MHICQSKTNIHTQRHAPPPPPCQVQSIVMRSARHGGSQSSTEWPLTCVFDEVRPSEGVEEEKGERKLFLSCISISQKDRKRRKNTPRHSWSIWVKKKNTLQREEIAEILDSFLFTGHFKRTVWAYFDYLCVLVGHRKPKTVSNVNNKRRIWIKMTAV